MVLWRIVIRPLRKGLKNGQRKLRKFGIPERDLCVSVRIVISSRLAKTYAGSGL
jgi:hypothetical protein